MQRKAVYRAGLGAVFAVAHNGVAQVLHVHAYLVFATGVEFHLHQCHAAAATNHLIVGDGELALVGIVGGIYLKL